MLSANMIPEFTDKTATGARAWWDAMLKLGYYIHPEDDPADQVNAETGQRALDNAACAKVTTIYEDMSSNIGESEACGIGVEAWYSYQGYTWDASKDEWVRQH
ncbi:MAG: hypothetical protein WBL07_04210 [Thiothrix litoralis]|jgi:hypothetical protein|uniref:hypothetical protein n=1 Tax=Thiothrix litoralis TaxID=2891210 RepID=UPI003C78ADBF